MYWNVIHVDFALKILLELLQIGYNCIFRATASTPKLETIDDLKKHVFTQGGRLKEEVKGKRRLYNWKKWKDWTHFQVKVNMGKFSSWFVLSFSC